MRMMLQKYQQGLEWRKSDIEWFIPQPTFQSHMRPCLGIGWFVLYSSFSAVTSGKVKMKFELFRRTPIVFSNLPMKRIWGGKNKEMALLLNVSALLGGDCGPCSGADNSDRHAIPKLHPSQNKTKYVQYSTNDARTILPKSISLLPLHKVYHIGNLH